MIDLDQHRWQTPDSYAGFNPVGDIVICSQNRDSSILEQSNYQAIFSHLQEFAKQMNARNIRGYMIFVLVIGLAVGSRQYWFAMMHHKN